MWQLEPLASLATVYTDGDWIESKDQSTDGIRLIQTGNVGEGHFKDRGEKARFVSFDTFKRLRCTEIFPGDCLISRLPDPVGRACLVPANGHRMITAVDCTIVRFDQAKLLPKYFTYYSQSSKYLEAVEAETTGTTRNRISRARLGLVPVTVAPLPEQRRIVAILDEAFEGIAIARGNAEKNLLNARELFESHLDAALFGNGAGYRDTILGKEVELLAGYAFSSAGYTSAGRSVRLLRGDNIMQGYLRWDDAKSWPEDNCAAYSRFALREGDVVLAMDRPWVQAGLKRAQILAADLPCLQVQRTARLRPKATLNLDYLFHLTGSRLFSQHLLEAQTGIGVPHISGKQIESFQFMRPPLHEQESIAGVLGELQLLITQLAAAYTQKLSALDELKRSLLHQAFGGAL